MPNFGVSETKVAKATMTNPTSKQFYYTAELYLGLPKVAGSGIVSFSLGPGESGDVYFSVTMPNVEGTYPVYLDVFSKGDLVAAYRATEDVTIIVSPAIDIGPIIWV